MQQTLPEGAKGELGYLGVVHPDIATGECPEDYFLCATRKSPVKTDQDWNAVRTCVPEDKTEKAKKDPVAYHTYMVEKYCPMTSIKMTLPPAETKRDKVAYSYIPFKGAGGKALVLQVGKFDKNLPITTFDSNPDLPCMDPKEPRNLPATAYHKEFQPLEYNDHHSSFDYSGGGCTKEINSGKFKDPRYQPVMETPGSLLGLSLFKVREENKVTDAMAE